MVTRELATLADPDADVVTVDGTPLPRTEALRYVLLYKPRGYVTTVRDPQGRPVVTDLVPSDVRLYPVGRLDAAMDMYEERRGSAQPVWLHAVDAVDLMLDLGRGDDAWASLRRGRELIEATGSKVFHNMSLLAEAKLCLRLDRDTKRADRVLAQAAANGITE